MEGIKKLFVFFRNALAFSFAWLVLCTAVISLAGGKEISAVFLLKILALCAWGSLSFVFSFFTKFMKKKGFIFCLTIFFLLFIPVEILMFYWMNIFTGTGTALVWMVLGVIVAVFYVASILIDVFVMRKRAKEYTDKLMEYTKGKT